MNTTKVAFSKVAKLVRIAFPEATKCRRPVVVEERAGTYHVSDYWDGGSRTYSRFVRLSDLTCVGSGDIPREARQASGNPLRLAIAEIEMAPGYVVIEHQFFCGKDCGYRIVMHPDYFGNMFALPEAV